MWLVASTTFAVIEAKDPCVFVHPLPLGEAVQDIRQLNLDD
jgi:hypothetical protein